MNMRGKIFALLVFCFGLLKAASGAPVELNLDTVLDWDSEDFVSVPELEKLMEPVKDFRVNTLGDSYDVASWKGFQLNEFELSLWNKEFLPIGIFRVQKNSVLSQVTITFDMRGKPADFQDKVEARLRKETKTAPDYMEIVSNGTRRKVKRWQQKKWYAHMDLRKAYQGFTYSHASIMYNALKLPSVSRLVQVGIRDYSDEELGVLDRGKGRIVTWFDDDLKAQLYEGHTWAALCDKIIADLPEHVYISFDIDGLDPRFCPGTGTPVPGGLDFQMATFLLKRLIASGRKIISFDLNEVAPGATDWDANVGARLLYQLCNWMCVSQGLLSSP